MIRDPSNLHWSGHYYLRICPAQEVRQLPGVGDRVIAVAVVYARLSAALTCVFAGGSQACRRSYRNITRL